MSSLHYYHLLSWSNRISKLLILTVNNRVNQGKWVHGACLTSLSEDRMNVNMISFFIKQYFIELKSTKMLSYLLSLIWRSEYSTVSWSCLFLVYIIVHSKTSYSRQKFVTRLELYNLSPNNMRRPVHIVREKFEERIWLRDKRKLGMDYVEGLNHSLLSLHRPEHHSRACKLAWRILQCFRVLDLGYFITGLALTISAVDHDISSHLENVLFGGSLLIFSFLSAICNLMALRGISSGSRR